jgi:hypothetical protein
VLGFFMSLGKAAVYKHIPVYYPDMSARSAAGRLIGGLGGFVLPIVFGALNDLTGHLDQLLHAAVRDRRRLAGLDASAIRADGAKEAASRSPQHAAAASGNAAEMHGPSMSARWGQAC